MKYIYILCAIIMIIFLYCIIIFVRGFVTSLVRYGIIFETFYVLLVCYHINIYLRRSWFFTKRGRQKITQRGFGAGSHCFAQLFVVYYRFVFSEYNAVDARVKTLNIVSSTGANATRLQFDTQYPARFGLLSFTKRRTSDRFSIRSTFASFAQPAK